jgi:uncharacterized protein (TIGR02453 family)
VSFRGWPATAIEFYEGLEADNSKTYWHAHKPVYEADVRGPMVELLAELAPEFGEGTVFRPNRDIRFRADKSPYKTVIAARLAGGGYVSFSAEGLSAGSGLYRPAGDQLDRYRRAVAEERSGAQLAEIVARARRTGMDIRGAESLKTAPRGYPKDHPRIELLRQKGLIGWKQWPVGAWLGTRSAKKRVETFLRATVPLTDWLAAHVGESTLPPDPRR